MDYEQQDRAPSPGSPAAYLHLVDSRSTHQSQILLPLWHKDIFKIGRDPNCNTLAIDDDADLMVSRNHCEVYVIEYEPTVNHIYVRDRKSSNGTFVNDHLIGRGSEITAGYLLQDGDKFTVVQEHAPPRHQLTSLQLEECELFAHRYQVTGRRLGQGAEAAVCLANEVWTGKQLVCKIVNLDKIQGKNAQEDIRRKFQEADILRQLRHPNILPYVDAITSPHTLYTFTELASGGDLMSFLFRHGRVKEFDARIIIRQVVRGLCYLHEKGIVHRDLKPENILLAYSPKIAYHRVMLSDFGISAIHHCNRMTTNAGTTAYQAPEFTRSGQSHTSAVDIWSLGVVTTILLAAEQHDEDLSRMDDNEIEGYIRVLFHSLPRLPSLDAYDFVWMCLQRNPSARMTADEAQEHEWMCSPLKHLKFFRLLDKRIMSTWKPQSKLKPMPWELPSLVKTGPPTPTREHGSSSQYFTGTPVRSKRQADESTVVDEGLVQQGDGSKGDGVSSPFAVPARSSRSKGTSLNGEEKKDVKSEISQPPWHGFLKPEHPRHAEVGEKRKRIPRIKVHGTELHPLPGLARHLPRSVNHFHRENVLLELQRSNSKFLVDEPCSIPSTPLEMVGGPVPAPLSPKKRKSTYDAMDKSAGRDQLAVPKIQFH
ncbi:hypothetical protein CEP52_005777 [Fusarium oligoseptatum]|uniref:Uncharacterized protein n=1 Tax=Fusarium oligoseptatum TaxID=2604345 RepID=A0A428TWD5_9HYPO|nr:hypothetical protein CEP52_005777 [Fusarium oligoseptatum]